VSATATYVPDFDVALGGRPLLADLRTRVTSVRFEEALEGANRVELQLANQTLRLLDRPGLDLRTPLTLSLGYRPAGLRKVFEGEITGVESDFPAGAMPSLTITAHDATQRLGQGKKERAFPYYIPDAVIAAIVAVENRLIPRGDLATASITGLGVWAARPRYQYKQSDYEFLRGMAAEYGVDMWVDGEYLNFRLPRRGLPAPQIELRWGESLIEFSPRLSDIGQLAAVRVEMWVEAMKTQIAIEISWDGERLAVRVIPAVLGEHDQALSATLTVSDMPYDTPADAIRWALGEMRRRLNSRLTATGSAIGDPRFRVGEIVAVDGLGARFSSRAYRLTSVAHSLDEGGYRTRFQVRQEVI
jgi:uncharacterized protein